MISSLYRKSFSLLMKRPLKLWGLSLLQLLLCWVAGIGFIGVPAAAAAVSLLLVASMQMIYLNSYRTGLDPKTSYLFAAFGKEQLWHVLGGMAWRELWVFVWGLIPIAVMVLVIVLGLSGAVSPFVLVVLYLAALGLQAFPLIRTYEYRFVPYILMTRRDVKPTEATAVSKKETMGYKSKMFWADVLPVLAVAAATLLLALLGAIPYLGLLFRLLMVLLMIAYYIFAPVFFGILHAAFYVEIQGRLAAPAQPTAPHPPVIPIPVQTPPEAPTAAQPESEPESAVAESAPAQPAHAPTEPSADTAAERTCPDCGAPVAPEAAFCTNCGRKL